MKFRKLTIMTAFVLFLVSGFSIWALKSPFIQDYYSMHYSRDKSGNSLALAFVIALRRNDPLLYQMTTLELHPKVDEWIATHKAQFCQEKPYVTLGGFGTIKGLKVLYACTPKDTTLYDYAIEVNNLVIINNKITEWSEINEDIKHK